MILIHHILKLFFHTVLPFLYIFVVSWHTIFLAFTVLSAYNVFIIVMNILVLTDSIEICILELDKVKNTYYKNKLDKKAQWMLFLDDPNSREVKEIMEKNNDIKDAVIEVHERSKDEQLRRLAELKEKAIMDEKAIYKAGRLRGEKEGIQKGLQEGVQKGIQKGITQGQLEKSIEIIKNLYSMNLTISQIAQAVDMSEQEVQKIIDKNS